MGWIVTRLAWMAVEQEFSKRHLRKQNDDLTSEIGILEKRNKISLSSLLQSHDCRRLEAQVRLQMEVRCVSHNAW